MKPGPARLLALLATATGLLLPAPTASATSTASASSATSTASTSFVFPGPGSYLHQSYDSAGDVYDYSLYVPSGYDPGTPSPLVVLLHGCNSTADQRAQSSAFNEVAEQRHAIVLYPDGDAYDRLLNGRCWRAVTDPQGETRDRGDAAAIAGMTRAVAAAWNVDTSRTYALGMSAGGFETSMLGADYPDLYAAIGVYSGAAYAHGLAGCAGPYLPTADTTALAQQAFEQMGPRRRPVPVILFHGDADPLVPYQCGLQALEQWRRTDDLALAAQGLPAIPARPTRSTDATVPGGRAYTTIEYGGLLEFWTVHGMAHTWSGGSTDPAVARFSDPTGPDASAAAWQFFARHHL
ncbi:alpha/beta hydrolase family esterase [Kitasatospora sp. NPDC056651]|uniref:extracellular catalytic domain type 1 short-chain-length polyhydroxyalkanoate depolymerase n=1 Tax=Kitasatospora sp. NPDC056651 TaxID=3345892 RepID=UPI003679E72F